MKLNCYLQPGQAKELLEMFGIDAFSAFISTAKNQAEKDYDTECVIVYTLRREDYFEVEFKPLDKIEFKRIFKLNEVNKNGRIYVAENFANIDDKIKNGMMLGELGHPSSFDMSLSRATHVIKDVKVNENDLIITARLLNLDTDNCRYAKALLKDLVLSPRGIGYCDENGMLVDYNVFTFDLISKSDAAWDVKDIED